MMFPKKVIDNRVKNTKRDLPPEVVQEVYTRDHFCCILCGSRNLDKPHHVYYGIDADFSVDRNNPEELVTLCIFCHRQKIHGGLEGHKEARARCIEYAKKIYGKV